jgi:hypothetical protein
MKKSDLPLGKIGKFSMEITLKIKTKNEGSNG